MATVAAVRPPNNDFMPSRTGNLFCGCCRPNAKKSTDKEPPLRVQPTLRLSTQHHQNGYQYRLDDVPRITVNTPMNKSPPVTVFPVEKSPISIIDTSRSSDQFETARTSRVEEASSYSSMDDLVRSIRSEAGLENTPRPDSPASMMSPYELLQETLVSELRIEGLAEYHMNRAAPLARIREIEECSISSTLSYPAKNQQAVVPTNSVERPLQVRRRTLLGRASSLPQAVLETVQFLYVAIVGALFALFSRLW